LMDDLLAALGGRTHAQQTPVAAMATGFFIEKFSALLPLDFQNTFEN
jgi:hypothetical protein